MTDLSNAIDGERITQHGSHHGAWKAVAWGFLGVLAFRLPLSDLLLPLGVLFGIAAVLFILSGVFFHRRFVASDRT